MEYKVHFNLAMTAAIAVLAGVVSLVTSTVVASRASRDAKAFRTVPKSKGSTRNLGG